MRQPGLYAISQITPFGSAAWPWNTPPNAPSCAGLTIVPPAASNAASVDAHPDTAGFIETIRPSGGQVLQELTDMPWGQFYAICAYPDGYPGGIKTTPSVDPA